MTIEKHEFDDKAFWMFVRTIPNFLKFNRNRKNPKLIIREKAYRGNRNYNPNYKNWIVELNYESKYKVVKGKVFGSY